MNFLKRVASITSLIANQSLNRVQQNVRAFSSSLSAPPTAERQFVPLTQIQTLTPKIVTDYLESLKPAKLPGEDRLLQMHRIPYIRTMKKKRHIFDGKPLCRGVVLRTLIKKPRKPNSANRKCVQLRMSTGRIMTAYVQGEGHNLQEHNVVLCKIARLRDTPGVKIKCIRGVYDLPHVVKKKD
ncbi:40S ribosomal protein S12, mitochondrial [Contarinia nasturtii]|uniref:40S ribosomal protein S12, mitochondrial n=1 Tax=Contarinia nasturtii TaxID=265458 RepID=UPI0012D3759F|nr:40S ribosomal protein S12, mitochondrial [Contarinia nasturtii]